MATIKDVAKAAGVSTATVSKVLSNRNWGKPETRQKVQAAIEQLQYKPNALARQLRTQQTKTIIVIIPNLDNYLYHDIIYGIETEAQKESYQVLIADMKNQPSIEQYYLNAIQQHEVDGVISLSATIVQRLLKQIADKYPVVLALQRVSDPDIPTVSIDNINAAEAITRHLIRIGHRKIAHITGNPELSVYKERMEGFLSALRKSGIEPDPGLICSGEAGMSGGYEQMDLLLSSGKECTAVVAAGDTMAIGAIHALRKRGLRVPQDCAVVGFDDIEVSSYFEPALTTIRQPRIQIGQAAFRKLLAQIKNEPVPNIREVLPYELIIRESCGYFL